MTLGNVRHCERRIAEMRKRNEEGRSMHANLQASLLRDICTSRRCRLSDEKKTQYNTLFSSPQLIFASCHCKVGNQMFCQCKDHSFAVDNESTSSSYQTSTDNITTSYGEKVDSARQACLALATTNV